MIDTPIKVDRADWASDPNRWSGRLEGTALGTDVSILFFDSDRIGAGPVLHAHPYDEIFIVREGNVRYTVGDQIIDATSGDIVRAPANTPHKFENLGPERLITTDIHLNATVIQHDLED